MFGDVHSLLPAKLYFVSGRIAIGLGQFLMSQPRWVPTQGTRLVNKRTAATTATTTSTATMVVVEKCDKYILCDLLRSLGYLHLASGVFIVFYSSLVYFIRFNYPLFYSIQFYLCNYSVPFLSRSSVQDLKNAKNNISSLFAFFKPWTRLRMHDQTLGFPLRTIITGWLFLWCRKAKKEPTTWIWLEQNTLTVPPKLRPWYRGRELVPATVRK